MKCSQDTRFPLQTAVFNLTHIISCIINKLYISTFSSSLPGEQYEAGGDDQYHLRTCGALPEGRLGNSV